MRHRLAPLALLLPVLACDAQDSGRDEDPAADTEAGAAELERQPLGKADGAGSCLDEDGADACGGQSADGCWCDDSCLEFGDCCSDKVATCDEPPPPPTECRRNLVVMGYWPPTNEMLRPFSTNALQNPGGWQGENWRGLGYDVYAFFPEFPPDGDPSNDAIGDDGAVGSPDFDLRVDYQATSADFWRIVDEHDPVLLLTSSRGGGIGWEIEAIEGGHGSFDGGDISRDWRSDGHGAVQFPTQATVDPRSWDAISQFRQGDTLPSALPIDAIEQATSALGIASVEIDETGTSGNFLSGFLGLHGLYYNRESDHNLAAGHIHVAIGLPTDTARQLLETTLVTMIEEHPADQAPCL